MRIKVYVPCALGTLGVGMVFCAPLLEAKIAEAEQDVQNAIEKIKQSEEDIHDIRVDIDRQKENIKHESELIVRWMTKVETLSDSVGRINMRAFDRLAKYREKYTHQLKKLREQANN